MTTISGFKSSFATVTTELFNVQPLSAEKTNLFNGVMGKTFVFFCDGVIDIQEGDRLRDVNSSDIYKVKNGGVSRKTHGSMDYLHIVAELIS